MSKGGPTIAAALSVAVPTMLATASPGAQTAGAAMPDAVSIDLEDARPGSLPPAFAAGLTGRGNAVRWEVREDPGAPNGPRVLVETSGNRPSDRFPLAIHQGFEGRDVAVEVRFKPLSGTVDQAAGLMVRVEDERNY